MKFKSISLVLAFIILGIITFILFRDRSPFGSRNTSFACPPDKEITGIEFSDGTSTLVLRNKDGLWLVNGKNETRHSSIGFILTVLKGMEIKSPVSPELFKTEISDKGIKPVRVKVTGNGRTLTSFLVYKTRSNDYGNMIKLREDSKPFIVWLPGNEVEIGSVFNLNALYWQPYTVFNLLPSEISSVSIVYTDDPESSFMITCSDKHYVLSGQPGVLSGWDTTLVRRYLSYFTFVPFESWALDQPDNEAARIESGEPVVRIIIDKPDGTKTRLALWKKQLTGEPDGDIDTDRLWGKLDDNNRLFIIRYIDVDPLLKKRSYFFGP